MAGLNLGDLTVSSPAFEHGGRIPDEHTCEGEDVSPPLEWSAVPEGTRELVIICHDPDAPLTDGFTHWVAYGIAPDSGGIEEGGGPHTEGSNDFGSTGYGGPAPPPGHGTHHYYFHLYAIDAELGAGPGLSRDEVLERIDEHIIEQARVVGTYSR
ncbi:MAG: YbhB/YbcL family Raf kinase inhibitor-like protein [Actinobacteria bacterium]|nr:MAG: YbhB/YbcL family Raf kinase inhibitor-like protein [Actinomycetota bacterium]RIK05831.1 MAG: YbhB/YbcL family Raf kinase inhibitor-like protein [Acidobacteriota bacterium]